MKAFLKKILSPKIRKRISDLFDRLLCAFCRFLPLRDVVLFYTIRANGELLDNSRAVYDALDCKKVIFAHMLPHSKKIMPRLYFYLLTSKVIVTDDYLKYMRTVKLRKGQRLLQIWHACGAFKKFGLDAPSQLTKEEEAATHSQYSAVAVTADKCKKAYSSAFGVSEDICLPLGLPRTDGLIKNSQRLNDSVFEKHPELKGKKIYLYCPTFREKDGKRYDYDPHINWQRLSDSLGEDEVFVIRRHPVMNYRLCSESYANITDLSDDSTLALTAACEVIITDYSSVIYDACILGVPAVFYCPDYEEYERGFYLEFPDGLPGEMITDSEKLLDTVRKTKENPPAERIEKFRSEQIEMCDGHSTERVAELINSWMK